MTNQQILKPKLLSGLIAAILGVTLLPAQAALINYTLTANTSYAQGNPVSSSDSNTSSDPVYTYSSVNNWSQNANLWASAQGDNQGWMYSVSSGDGQHYRVDSAMMQSVVLENDTGVAQNYSYDFLINFGSLTANNYNFSTAAEYSNAGYLVQILLNNSVLWQSSAQLSTNLNGTLATFGGTQWSTYNDDSEWFSWGEYSSTLNLGLLNAGQSLNLSYVISTYVEGNHLGCGYGYAPSFTALTSTDEGVGDIEQSVVEVADCGYGDGYGYGISGYTYAQFGDPNSFSGSPVAFDNSNITGSPASAVSAPAPLALLGVGLAGLAFRRRKAQ